MLKKENLLAIGIGVVSVGLLIVIVMGFLLFDRLEEESGGISKTPIVENTEEQLAQEQSRPNSSGAQLDVKATNAEVEQIVQKVFRHMYLPSGDVRIETVAKPEQLKIEDPQFFEFVREGDHLLFYADRVILYDPFVDKVIDIKHTAREGQ